MVITINIICALLTLFYVGLLLLLNRGWLRLPDFRAVKKEPVTSVSIIIAARNEEANIARTIDAILVQTYPRQLYELIVVDDHSTDKTAEIIRGYQKDGVKLVQLNEKEILNSYKKKAIAEAISTSSGELIVTTDADCYMGSKWLETIVNYYEQKDFKMISSPVCYFEERNSFEEMQTLEFLFLIGLGAAGIGNKMPTTCNGANLSYRKDAFLEVGGFKGIDNLASGDDELLLHKIGTRYPDGIGFCKSKDAVVYTQAKETLKEFISQRKRWASKSTKYKDKRIVFVAVFVWLFNAFLLANFFMAFFVDYAMKAFLFQYLVKMLFEIVFLSKVTAFNKRSELLKYVPVLSLIHPVYMVYIGLVGNSGKYDWKGRMVR
ncbi:glycosyl transferase family 2 [Pseudopedobacter saltans DSM 12145]|uniref:Glycosyl transferase family 2 n=1 Tax=Pseudopedobacter saltans (strain ATCC 51119 / DSM 12145 / JCM 21818 / CCUG 39354 / LMG 10337 / NBRC 100064 / NCIMB 13643) TaxID=762903 RepID=F0S704_PSESL|nr:glycosyltransferase [Pseudopedobacter saltans]ADY53267.1 glycosyl transferase family 2 [Pseudopedobacter saltans DSM 12145]